MTNGVMNSSILRQMAEKRKFKSVDKAPGDTQISIIKDTLNALDNYLDTSDLRMLTTKALSVIRDDILEIITTLRNLKAKQDFGQVNSVDGALEDLRVARDTIQIGLGLFDKNGRFDDTKSKKLLPEMRSARQKIESALSMLNPL